jgi:hypothetical protein
MSPVTSSTEMARWTEDIVSSETMEEHKDSLTDQSPLSSIIVLVRPGPQKAIFTSNRAESEKLWNTKHLMKRQGLKRST